MATEHSPEQIPCDLPLCPNCAKPMRLIQTWPGFGGLPVRSSFECKRCGILFTEVVTGKSPVPERVSALHHELFDALQ